MAQGYHTLQEAAEVLGMPVDELKHLAKTGQIRSFQDRGTLRFRIQDVQELARVRGASSDPELVLGDASLPAPKSAAAPPSGTKKKSALAGPNALGKQEDVPDDLPSPSASSPERAAKSKLGPKSGQKPAPKSAGSDSDVRLVPGGNDVMFSVPKSAPKSKLGASDVKITPDPLKPKTNMHPPGHASGGKRRSQFVLDSDTQPKSKSGGPSHHSKLGPPQPGSGTQPLDSGVCLVLMDDDSDTNQLGASDEVPLGMAGPSAPTDSNVRLERVPLPAADSGEGNRMLTEEINLDDEIKTQQENKKNKGPATKFRAKSQFKPPTASPFELSDAELELPSELIDSGGPKAPAPAEAEQTDSGNFERAAQPGENAGTDHDIAALLSPDDDGASDFDLVPAADGTILIEDGGNDFSLEAADDNEKEDSDSSDFDLSLEAEDTPKPQLSNPIDDSDSEFELKPAQSPTRSKKPAQDDPGSDIDLSLDADEGDSAANEGDDSEFELNLENTGEGARRGTADSDSESELTLDDSGSLAVEEAEAPAPQVKSKKKAPPPSAVEQDIFDTDFEVPALDESDDATVADSELESSDFDIALQDSELAAEEESGSQVVALDEESETVADDEDGAVVEEDSSDFSELDQDVQVDEEDDADVDDDEETETAGAGKRQTIIKEKLIPPAPWGVMPVVFMLPCVVVMFLVGILGYEMVQASAGLKPPGVLTEAIAGMFGPKVTLK